MKFNEDNMNNKYSLFIFLFLFNSLHGMSESQRGSALVRRPISSLQSLDRQTLIHVKFEEQHFKILAQNVATLRCEKSP